MSRQKRNAKRRQAEYGKQNTKQPAANQKGRRDRSVSDNRASRAILYAGIPSALLFTVYVLYALTNAYPYYEILVGCIALAAIGIAIVIRNLGGRHLQRLIAFFLCFFMITFLILQVFVLCAYHAQPKLEGKFVIEVMGCRCYGWEPGKALKARLDAALELLNAYPDAVCVVSGGKGANELVEEARVMQKYLTDHGIGAERIFTEETATDTKENVLRIQQLLRDEGLDGLPVVAVSSAYHLPRVQLIHRLYDCGSVSGYGAYASDVSSWIAYSVREYMATVKTGLNYAVSRIGGLL